MKLFFWPTGVGWIRISWALLVYSERNSVGLVQFDSLLRCFGLAGCAVECI